MAAEFGKSDSIWGSKTWCGAGDPGHGGKKDRRSISSPATTRVENRWGREGGGLLDRSTAQPYLPSIARLGHGVSAVEGPIDFPCWPAE